jgi:predicted enzyme related to lactoylglutathione lyase
MAGAVGHFEIHTKDTAKASEFYSSVFGWTVDTNNPMGYGMVSTGAEGGITGGIAGPDMGPPMVTFYVESDDIEASLQKAEAHGAKRLMGPEAIEGGPEVGMFADPDGNVIGVMKGM